MPGDAPWPKVISDGKVRYRTAGEGDQTHIVTPVCELVLQKRLRQLLDGVQEPL